MAELKIAGRRVGNGQPCFIVAEAGVNHNGCVELAFKMVDEASNSGVDAIKFQTFKSEHVVSRQAPKARYQTETTGGDESQLDMVRRYELTDSQFEDVKRYCDRRGLLFLSTPFDIPSVDFLAGLGVPAIKIASGDVDNVPLLRVAARTGLPLIVSTGMATLADVDGALRTVREAGGNVISILQCVSNYPADAADANLRAIPAMAAAFGIPVGYSDHTLGCEVALAAVAFGACVLEKHFTLDKTFAGPDHRASLDPRELAALVKGVRLVEAAMGDGVKAPRPSEGDVRIVARRSLFSARDVGIGEVLGDDAVIALRPSGGIPPSLVDLVVGRPAARTIKAGAMLSWKDVR